MNFQENEIEDRLSVIGTYYDLDTLLSDKTDNEAISRYYRKSDFFYNLLHSHGGYNIHMGLSDDAFFHKEDFEKQARFVGEFLKILKKWLSYDVTINSIAGSLMLFTFDGENIHRYCRIVATKANEMC